MYYEDDTWNEGYFLYFDGSIGTIDFTCPDGGIGGNSDEVVALESTGYIDKTGKEIYVGDIIKNNWRDAIQAIEDIREVNWLMSDGFLAGQDDGNNKLMEAEIIGNIYENNDLLK